MGKSVERTVAASRNPRRPWERRPFRLSVERIEQLRHVRLLVSRQTKAGTLGILRIMPREPERSADGDHPAGPTPRAVDHLEVDSPYLSQEAAWVST